MKNTNNKKDISILKKIFSFSKEEEEKIKNKNPDQEKLLKIYQEYNNFLNEINIAYNVNIIFDLFTFEELLYFFYRNNYFDLIIDFYNKKDELIYTLSKNDNETILSIFNINNTNILIISKLLELFYQTYLIIFVMNNHLSIVKEFRGKLVFVDNSEYKNYTSKLESKYKWHFFSPEIKFYDYLIFVNMIKKNLLDNGFEISNIKEIDFLGAMYINCKLKESI